MNELNFDFLQDYPVVLKKIKVFATSHKMTFQEAIIFLLEKVNSPFQVEAKAMRTLFFTKEGELTSDEATR